jgi:N-acetylglucosamine kinase-like BadF-type ATPase
MIGIFEAGGTKTEFLLGDKELILQKSAAGIHPMFMDDDAILQVLRELATDLSELYPKEIWFYGASCAGHELKGKMQRILKLVFPDIPVFVESDLLGTARALCGHAPGFAAILGTGSNACIFDGKDIMKGMLSFGFWLGDEGSGGYLGKAVFRAWLKGLLDSDLSKMAESEFGCAKESALRAILEDPKPNARIARLGGMAIKNKNHPAFSNLIRRSLQDFFSENGDLISEAKGLPFHFSGSVAFYLQEEIRNLLLEAGHEPGIFSDRTAERLFRYHLTS